MRTLFTITLVALLAVMLMACGAQPTPETITVVETVVVEKEVAGETVTVVETVVVEKEVEVEKYVTNRGQYAHNFSFSNEYFLGACC